MTQRRREFVLAVLRGTAGSIAMAMGLDMRPYERLRWALQRPSLVDHEAVSELERMTRVLTDRYQQSTCPGLMTPSVAGHLAMVTEFIQSFVPPGLHVRLCAVAAETTALRGALEWQRGEYDEAEHYFRAAFDAAHEAGDKALGAWLLGCLADRPYSKTDPAKRLAWLQGRTKGVAITDATPHTQAWLRLLEAGGYALQGRAADFDRAVFASHELLEHRDDPERRRPGTPFFGRIYLEEESSAAMLRMGRLTQSRETMEGVFPDATGRIRLWLLAHMALAAAEEQEPELACEYGTVALREAKVGGIEPILASVRRLGPALTGYHGVPVVRELMEELRVA